MRVYATQHVHIVVGGAYEERVVDVTLLPRQLQLGSECLFRRGLRHRVRHLEIRCHATISRRPALTLYVCLSCKPRLAEVHVAVYDTR